VGLDPLCKEYPKHSSDQSMHGMRPVPMPVPMPVPGSVSAPAPAPALASTAATHGPNRFYELLEAVKTEYEVAISSPTNTSESSRHMSRDDYELKRKHKLSLKSAIFIICSSSACQRHECHAANHCRARKNLSPHETRIRRRNWRSAPEYKRQ
jgi:hypothetical protein